MSINFGFFWIYRLRIGEDREERFIPFRMVSEIKLTVVLHGCFFPGTFRTGTHPRLRRRGTWFPIRLIPRQRVLQKTPPKSLFLLLSMICACHGDGYALKGKGFLYLIEHIRHLALITPNKVSPEAAQLAGAVEIPLSRLYIRGLPKTRNPFFDKLHDLTLPLPF